MSQPTKYTPSHAFLGDSATLANFPGQQLDVEFNNVAASIAQTDNNLAMIQRDDGALANASVTFDQLSPALQSAGLAPMNAWATGTSYLVSQIVATSTGIYKCLISHVSGVFATDLAAGDWGLVATLPVGPQGLSGTITPGSTTTLAAGSSATVTDTGTPQAAIFNFGIPQGTQGVAGPTGPTGPAGATGISGTPTVNQLATFTNSTTIQGVSLTGLVKGNGASAPTAAAAGTDYLAPAAIGTTVEAFDPQLTSNIPQNSKSAAYTTVLTDGEKHIFHPDADTTARTWTIDSNANVPYPIGTTITFVNGHGAGVITIAITTDTMRLAGAGTAGSRTLAADGIATAIKVTSTEWKISGTGLT